MAEIVGLFVGPVTEVVKCLGEPIMRQFNYLCCFNSNKQNLRDVAKDLVEKKEEVQGRVSVAQNNNEQILPAVTSWLGEVDKIQGGMNGIDNQIRDIRSGCSAAKSRFLLSRRVRKTSEAMEKLLSKCPKSNEPISRRQPPPSMEVPHVPETPAPEFESRKKIEGDVMAILRDEKVYVMGICGMGGLGKTTLANKIKDRVKVVHLFGESVMAVVSQQPDKLKIQGELAENLGLELKDIANLSSRAHRLRARLNKEGKRVLVVLDDVWEDLDLEELGITCKSGYQGCTILLTSRDRDVLIRMDAQPICEMKILSEIEAWSLFQQNVGGTCLDDQTLLSVARDVVKECRGLPLAIVTVARALKGHDRPTWQDALQQLKSSNPEDLENVLKDVYTPLKLSYDFLSENAKSIFLLCCLFPEDANISLEYLTLYAMGLSMFEGIRSLERVRNKIYSLVGKLKNRCLLLDSWGKHHVRMHDVVRDVAIFIASSKEKQLIRCGDKGAWVSTFQTERSELIEGANFPNLRLLLIQGEKWQISDNYFERVININVLSMSSIDSMKSSLPHTAILLKGLRTLILGHMNLETISVVAELERLEVFICRDCPHIKMLPIEVGRLVQLKLLEFSYCGKLKRVAPGLISTLVGLEELKMVHSFDRWESEKIVGKERTNAALSELQSLSSLKCLIIQIKDTRLAAEQFNLPQNVKKYDIHISPVDSAGPPSQEYDRNILVRLAEKEITCFGNWFAECISNVEKMRLLGEGSNLVNLRQVHQNMRWLNLAESSTVKKLVNITPSIGDNSAVFPQLEYLNLSRLVNLDEIYHIDGPIQEGSSINAFHNLKDVCLYKLPALKHWWKSSPYQHSACLPQLQDLKISECEMMEQVFFWTKEENENGNGTIIFPKLKILELSKLPKLTSLSKGIERIGFPLLSQMNIRECPQLKSLVSDHDENDDSSHLFCKQVSSGTFSRLERLQITNCGKITSLFASSIAQNLSNLSTLIIDDCEEMVEVFEDDKGETSGLFPRLQELEIIDLPKLKEFCWWPQMEFPLLRKLRILGSPEMERLSSGSLTAPNLEVLSVNLKDIDIHKGEDLNAQLQQHLSEAKEEESFYKWVLKIKGMERMGDLWSEFIRTKERLELVIKDSTQAAEQISFPSDIGRYRVTICTSRDVKILPLCTQFLRFKYFPDVTFDRELRLHLPTKIIFGDWIHDYVRSVEDIWLLGDGAMNLDLGRAQNMRRLTLTETSMVKKLMNITPPGTTAAPVFPHLEMLKLENLPNLEEICPEGSSVNVFNNLKQLHVECLPVLKHLWKSNSPYPDNASILQLERLHIRDCEMIQQVLLWSDGDEIELENRQTTITFRNLMDLTLSDLPRLKAVCNGIKNIEFPRLSSLQIRACPQLKSAVSIVCSAASDDQQNSENARDQNTHFLCNSQKVAFGGLKNLEIGGCKTASSSIRNSSILWCANFQNHDLFPRLEILRVHDFNDIRSLFSCSVVRNLNNLRSLTISSCAEMVKVIEEDDDDNYKEIDASCEMSRACVFPKLQRLCIQALPKLEMFCGWKSCALEFPSLIKMQIDSCPEMKIFSMGSFTAPYQVTVEINGKEVINHTKELNVMMQQPVFRGDLEE